MTRRAAGNGSLHYRADKGLWVAQHGGVYRYSKDKNKARTKLNELLTRSEASKPANITVSTLLDQWLDFATPNLKPASIKRYDEIIRIYLKQALGQCKLSSLTAYEVQQQYSKWLSQGVDSGKAAAIVAELDTVKLPNIDEFLDELRFALEVQTSNIRERVSNAREQVPSVWSTEEYDAARAEKDERYRRYLEHEARLAQQDKARREQMSPISDSSSMADAMNGEKRLDPSIKVNSAVHDDADNGVLPYDEVIKALAAKAR